MSKFSKVLTAMTVLPVLAFAGSAYATSGGNGQIEQGDIYRAKDVTTNSAFADNITATCGDTVAFRVRVHNGGPGTLTNVKVLATLDQGSSTTSHGSRVTVGADNNLHGADVTANAGVNTGSATVATYVGSSTQLLNYSTTPGDESVIGSLPDGILSGTVNSDGTITGGVNIGSVGPLTSDTEEVQFEAKVSCPTPPPTPTFACTELGLTAENSRTVQISKFTTSATNGASFSNANITWGDGQAANGVQNPVGQTHQYGADGTFTVTATANFKVGGKVVSATSVNCQKQVTFSSTTPPTVTPPTTPPATPPAPTALVNTGPGSVVALFGAAAAAGTFAYRRMLGRRLSRQ